VWGAVVARGAEDDGERVHPVTAVLQLRNRHIAETRHHLMTGSRLNLDCSGPPRGFSLCACTMAVSVRKLRENMASIQTLQRHWRSQEFSDIHRAGGDSMPGQLGQRETRLDITDGVPVTA